MIGPKRLDQNDLALVKPFEDRRADRRRRTGHTRRHSHAQAIRPARRHDGPRGRLGCVSRPSWHRLGSSRHRRWQPPFYDGAVRMGDPKLLPPVTGGATRQRSVLNGLQALQPHAPDRVLIHDAARPFVAPDIIDRVLAALGDCQGAIAAVPLADTLKRSGPAQGSQPPSSARTCGGRRRRRAFASPKYWPHTRGPPQRATRT